MEQTQEQQVFGKGPYTFVYGKKEQYRLELWPLSLRDQLKITGLVVTFITSIASFTSEGSEATRLDVVKGMADLIAKNFTKIAAIAADLPETDERIASLEENVTNNQLMEFVQYIWETNYGSVRKNYEGLISELAGMLSRAK